MARHAEEETTRCHVHLFARDKERIEALYGSSVGFSKAIRTIVRKFLDQADAAAAAKAKPLSLEPIDK